ncbi:MAG: hypothetical protein A2148_02885 [Chloroflexi bacterium RBG_16_68_14]|nr:MAG: hypothetical protein A2148_02885 [Chloroflexi bacterium RBG_16_68_14]
MSGPSGHSENVESAELGPLLRQVTATIRAILEPDQVYVCLWSFAGWVAGHLHFVLQPAWSRLQQEYPRPGPFLQVDMFQANELPPRRQVEAFVEKAKAILEAADAKDAALGSTA